MANANLDRLLSQLNISGLQQKDNPLYQVIAQLIKSLSALQAKLESGTLEGNSSTDIITSNGTIGPPGMPGDDGSDGMIGPPGLRGIDGISGIAGSVGPIGLSGEDGLQGFPIPGNIGLTGIQGIQGLQGPITLGPMGLNGEDGLMGIPIPGNQGIQGTQGLQGIQGPIGPSGINGNIGPIGLSGVDGEDGISTPGPQGIQGIPGGGGAVTRLLLIIPFPARLEQKINIIDTTIATTSKINAWLSGLAPEVVGSGDAVDMLNTQSIAKAGSFDLIFDFRTPFAGSLSVDYSVFA